MSVSPYTVWLHFQFAAVLMKGTFGKSLHISCNYHFVCKFLYTHLNQSAMWLINKSTPSTEVP